VIWRLGLGLTLAACARDGQSTPPVETDSDAETEDSDPTISVDDPYGDIALLPIPESFSDNGDGTWSLATGDELYDVGLAFYAEYPDSFDFLVVYTEFEVAGLFAFAVPLDHDIEGIGLQEVMALYGWSDLSPATAGSDGRLQQIQLMNGPDVYIPGALFGPQDILVHETGHRWSAYAQIPGPDPFALTDTWHSHWNVYGNVGGPSALGYGQLVDGGNGRFTYEIVVPLQYSNLELYQQGLIGADEVGPLFGVESPTNFDPPTNGAAAWDAGSFGSPASYDATRLDFDIDDVISMHGPRVPAAVDAQAEFRFAFALVCAEPAACDGAALEFVEAQRTAFVATFSAATGGRGTARTDLQP